MRRRTRPGALAAVAAAVLLGACTGSGPSEYGEDVRDNFVEACTEAGGGEELCGCSYERVSEEIPFDRLDEIEDDLRDGAELPPELSDLFARCGAAGPAPAESSTTTEG